VLPAGLQRADFFVDVAERSFVGGTHDVHHRERPVGGSCLDRHGQVDVVKDDKPIPPIPVSMHGTIAGHSPRQARSHVRGH
jgi:hypothetical protein